MNAPLLAPTFTAPEQLVPTVRDRGYAVLSPSDVASWSGAPIAALDAMRPDWDSLPPDAWLKDGGRYRRRRHSCFVVTPESVEQVAHRAHSAIPWSTTRRRAGCSAGSSRWPLDGGAPGMGALLRSLARTCAALRPDAPRWFVEAHQFRIDTTDGIGRPTPEGAHRDGVDFVAVLLVAREGVKGGETRVFEASGPRGERFTLTEPWTMMLLDDARVIHESTPIQPTSSEGHRDTLVITLRAEGVSRRGELTKAQGFSCDIPCQTKTRVMARDVA
ncbi:MAG: 2OG-Fe dioxygenase family protein [Deltaproteobacteria bacterium]|nr:2OG-Fe dioxygenase family protein [Deltaproteobacteria bacterium]